LFGSSPARAARSAAAADAFAAAFEPLVPRALTGPAMPDTRAVTTQENSGRCAAPAAALSQVRSVTYPGLD
jgi:hypothetical protein